VTWWQIALLIYGAGFALVAMFFIAQAFSEPTETWTDVALMVAFFGLYWPILLGAFLWTWCWMIVLLPTRRRA
jgi:hypothetical protein